MIGQLDQADLGQPPSERPPEAVKEPPRSILRPDDFGWNPGDPVVVPDSGLASVSLPRLTIRPA